MKQIKLLIILGCIIASQQIFARVIFFSKEDSRPKIEKDFDFYAPLTFYEKPYNDTRNVFENPSMPMAYQLTDLIYQGVDYGIGAGATYVGAPTWAEFGVLFIASVGLNFTAGVYMHEEGHHMAYNVGGIEAYNGWTVTKYGDNQEQKMNEFKANNPADFARISSIGMETTNYSNKIMMSRAVELNTKSNDIFTMWFGTFGNIQYIFNAVGEVEERKKLADQAKTENLTQEQYEDRISETGLSNDPSSWVYEIFNPQEPAFKSGGSYATLRTSEAFWSPTEDELNYLQNTLYLYGLNLVNPMMYGIRRFEADDFYYNGFLNVLMTPFGRQHTLDMFLIPKSNNERFNFSVSLNTSKNKVGLGLAFKHSFLKIPFGNISYELQGWQQPKDNLFVATEMALGGMASLNVNIKLLENLDFSVGGGYKTKGFSLGTLYMNETGFATTGIVAKF
ncbi:MAG: hypothetical protein ACRCSK_07870 [Fusobacteriaceae bacterium]